MKENIDASRFHLSSAHPRGPGTTSKRPYHRRASLCCPSGSPLGVSHRIARICAMKHVHGACVDAFIRCSQPWVAALRRHGPPGRRGVRRQRLLRVVQRGRRCCHPAGPRARKSSWSGGASGIKPGSQGVFMLCARCPSSAMSSARPGMATNVAWPPCAVHCRAK